MNMWAQTGSPPRPSQLANREHHKASDQKQKNRHCQVGLLLKFLEPFVDTGRSLAKGCTNKEKQWDSGGDERYDLENHSSPSELVFTESNIIRRGSHFRTETIAQLRGASPLLHEI